MDRFEDRQTGKTVGLMLYALGDAVLARGEEVEFIDHEPHTCLAARRMERELLDMAKSLKLSMAARRDGARLYVWSCWRSPYRNEKAEERNLK